MRTQLTSEAGYIGNSELAYYYWILPCKIVFIMWNSLEAHGQRQSRLHNFIGFPQGSWHSGRALTQSWEFLEKQTAKNMKKYYWKGK